jgi:exodeoxyribonuclease VII small subunit
MTAPDESFEASTERLTKIVDELEGGELPLERALALFEEGVRLARLAQERIERAERRVEELLAVDSDGRPIVRELEELGEQADEAGGPRVLEPRSDPRRRKGTS